MQHDIKTVDKVIGSFYDAARGVVDWSQPLEQTAALINAPLAVFSVHDPIEHTTELVCGQFGRDRAFPASYSVAFALMPPVTVSKLFDPATTVIKPFEIFGREPVMQSTFYQRCCAEHGYHDLMVSVLDRAPNAIATIMFGRLKSQPLFDAADYAILELITPHAIRALEMFNTLKSRKGALDDLMHAVDDLPIAMLVVDASRTVHQLNKVAGALFGDTGLMSIDQGKLAFKFADANRSLDKALGWETPSRYSFTLPSDPPLTVTLIPTTEGREAPAVKGDHRFLVLVHQTAAVSPALGATLNATYNLTPAEFRVLEKLLAGGTRESIAHDLCLSLATVKTHLAKLFAKTGTNRQAELLLKAVSVLPRHAGAVAA